MSLVKAIKNLKKAEGLLVTPRVLEFLTNNPDGVVWDDAGYELWREITQRALGNEDRSNRFGASSRGDCMRRQIFKYLGMPVQKIINADTQNLFNDGKWRHLRWQMMGVQSGALTHAEWPVELAKYRVKSSIDGLNVYEKFGFELKGDRNWSRTLTGVPDNHDLQIHTMMMAMGWDTFAYVVENKETQDWREIVVRRDPAVIKIVKRELQELNEHVEDQRLPSILPACAAKQGPYRNCPFAAGCLARHKQGDNWPTARSWDS